MLAVVGPANASASSSVSNVRGIELAAEHTQGTFSGYSTGAFGGVWVAVVDHTPLGPNARITGGTLSLTPGNTSRKPLTGQFTGGTITNTNPGVGCTNQTFRVVGNLAGLGGGRSGRFAVTLTHYRHRLLGECIAYFATTTGTLTLS